MVVFRTIRQIQYCVMWPEMRTWKYRWGNGGCFYGCPKAVMTFRAAINEKTKVMESAQSQWNSIQLLYRIEMFRKKQKQYTKNIEKVQSIVLSSSPVYQTSKQNHNQKLNEKYQAYTSPPNRLLIAPNSNFSLNASQIKAESFLKKCHIIDSPEIVFKAVELLQEKRYSFDEKEKNRPIQPVSAGVASIRYRFKEEISQRRQYKKLIQQMKQQLEVIGQTDMKATDIFIYKQQLLNVYLERVLAQLGKECREKALSMQIIWNSMTDLMEKVLKILLGKIEEEEVRQLRGFQGVHDEIRNSIEKVSEETHKLREKLDLKDGIITKIEKKIVEEQKKKLKVKVKQGSDNLQNIYLGSKAYQQYTVEVKEVSTQTTASKKQTQTPKKTFESIGITVKESKFVKSMGTQLQKQLMFEIRSVDLTVISEKPRKTALQERETTKTTQTQQTRTEQQYCQTQGPHSLNNSQQKPRSSDIRKSSNLSNLMDRSSIMLRSQKLDKSTLSQSSHVQEKRSSKKNHKKVSNTLQTRKQIMKALEEEEPLIQKDSETDDYVEINLPVPRTSKLSGFCKSDNSNGKPSASQINIRTSHLYSESRSPPPKRQVTSQWRRERSNKKATNSTYSLSNKQTLKTEPQDIQTLIENVPVKKRQGLLKVVKTFDEEIECIIQSNVHYQQCQKNKQSASRLRESIYDSFSKKISTCKKPVSHEKQSGVCRIISELYSMTYEKINKGKGMQFIDTIFDYFTISYGNHNKNFVIQKVSCFLAEAKQLQSSNIHIELFCLLARLTKYPQTDDLISEDFEVCIRLLIELNCDKKGFYVESNFTTIEKLKTTCEPLLAKCIGATKASDISKTMQALITKSLDAKDDKDIYRISVSSTILFVLNRIAKQRSGYHRELGKLIKLLCLPNSHNIQTRVLEILLKYLNISKKLYVASCIQFKNDTKIKSNIRVSSFITYLMKIDYPLPQSTTKYLSQRYKLALRQFQKKQDYISYLNELSMSVVSMTSQYIIHNLKEDPTTLELDYLQQVLIYHKLQEQATNILNEIAGKDLECAFCLGLQLLIKE